jgi:hypothetical protein
LAHRTFDPTEWFRQLIRKCSPAVLRAGGGLELGTEFADAGTGEALHGQRDINSLRAFPTGPGILSLFDSPSHRRRSAAKFVCEKSRSATPLSKSRESIVSPYSNRELFIAFEVCPGI